MKRTGHIRLHRPLVLSIVLLASLITFAGRAQAQKTYSDVAYRDTTFACLNDLSKKFTWESQFGQWVDIKTGKAVPDAIVGEALVSVSKSSVDPNRAYNSQTGQNLYWDRKTKTWKDSKTGRAVTSGNARDALFCCLKKVNYTWESQFGQWVDIATGKSVSASAVGEALISVEKNLGDPNRAFDKKTGRNFAWNDKKQAWIDVKTGESVCPKVKPESDECKRPLTKKGAIACIERLIARVTKAYDARRAELGDRPYFRECTARLKTIFDEAGVPADVDYVDFWGSVCTSWDAASVFYTRHLDNLKNSKIRIENTHEFTEPDIKYLEDGVDLWFQDEARLVSLMIERWKHLRTSGGYRRDWSSAVKRTRAAKTNTERMVAEAAESVAYHTNRNYYDVITNDNREFRAFGDKTIFTSIPRTPNTP
jgi:hypothetical protein